VTICNASATRGRCRSGTGQDSRSNRLLTTATSRDPRRESVATSPCSRCLRVEYGGGTRFAPSAGGPRGPPRHSTRRSRGRSDPRRPSDTRLRPRPSRARASNASPSRWNPGRT
jgi:hypothetical protein